MIEQETWSDPQWPPGTVRLEHLHADRRADIILQPRPTFNPNDPLNWPRWRKSLTFGLTAFFGLMASAQVSATTPTWGPMGTELGASATSCSTTPYAIGCATLALGGFMLMPFRAEIRSAARLRLVLQPRREAWRWWRPGLVVVVVRLPVRPGDETVMILRFEESGFNWRTELIPGRHVDDIEGRGPSSGA